MAGELLDLSIALTELVSAVAAIDDFAARTDSVAAGWFHGPPGGVPFACVSPPEVTTEDDRSRSDTWARTATFQVRAWRAFTSETQAARTTAAVELADELLTAVEDRYATSEQLCQADGILCRTASTDKVVAESAPDFVFAELTVEVRYRRYTGRGGV